MESQDPPLHAFPILDLIITYGEWVPVESDVPSDIYSLRFEEQLNGVISKE